MNEILLTIIVAYVFLSGLLLLAVIHSQLLWWLKAALVMVALGFYYLSYLGWSQAQGWPTDTVPPTRFLLHFSVIEEPDKERDFDGHIFIWLSDLKGQTLSESPRAYRVPYSRSLHARLQAAMRSMQDGNSQIGFVYVDDKKIQSEMKGSLARDEESAITFSNLPDFSLPEK